jgi:hypothetical protein
MVARGFSSVKEPFEYQTGIFLMRFNWNEYATLSEELSKRDNEASLRTAISFPVWVSIPQSQTSPNRQLASSTPPW